MSSSHRPATSFWANSDAGKHAGVPALVPTMTHEAQLEAYREGARKWKLLFDEANRRLAAVIALCDYIDQSGYAPEVVRDVRAAATGETP